MPKFFFDSSVNGTEMGDEEGVVLADTLAARKEAVIALYDMAREAALDKGTCAATMAVRDSNAASIFMVSLYLSISS